MKVVRDTHEWPEAIAVCDIETANWVNVRCLCHVDTLGDRKLFADRPGRCAEDQYLDWLFSLGGFGGEIVWAHWGGRFDFMFLLPKLHKRGWSTRLFVSGSQIILMEVRSAEGVCIKFADSARLMPDSVEKIGKSVRLPKLDADREHIDDLPWDELVEYCFRDCDIVLKGLCEMRDILTGDGYDFAYTLASIVTRRVRRGETVDFSRFRVPSVEKKRGYDIDPYFALADKFASHAYSGGRTEAFFVGRAEGIRAYLYDITSAYPWAMLSELPLYFKEFRPGPALDCELHPAFRDVSGEMELPGVNLWPKNHRDTARYLKACGVSQAWVRIPETTLKYPLLFAKDLSSGKLIFPEGWFSGVWTNIELLALWQHMKHVDGFRLIITGQAIYEPVAFMRPLIQSLWAKRLEALNTCQHCQHHKTMHGAEAGCSSVNCDCEKFEADEFRAYTYKIAMNSASGKLAEQAAKTQILMGKAARVEMRRLQELRAKEKRLLDVLKPVIPKYAELSLEEQEAARKRLREYYANANTPLVQRTYDMPNNVLATKIPGVFTITTLQPGPFRHAAAAAYVTAMTRIRLWEAFVKAEQCGAMVYYCDTDSIIVSEPIFGEAPADKQLGTWNLEAVITELEIWAPKVYRYRKSNGEVVWKAKGMPIMRREDKGKPELSQERWNQFTTHVGGDGRAPKPEKGGIESVYSRIAAGELAPKAVLLKRQLKHTDTKRRHYGGDSHPLLLQGVGRDHDFPSSKRQSGR